MLPVITPPFVIGLGIILICGRSGVVNALLERWFDLPPTRWIYGLPGVLLAQLFAFTPVAFLVLVGVIESVSPTLEEAGQTLGGRSGHVFRTVSLPLMAPGLANAFLVGFVESIADFGNPLVLGGNFSVLATEVYFALVGAQYDQGRAAALAVILLALALLAFLAQQRLLGGRAYTSVTGKGDAGIPVALPRPLVRALVVVAVPWLALHRASSTAWRWWGDSSPCGAATTRSPCVTSPRRSASSGARPGSSGPAAPGTRCGIPCGSPPWPRR